MKYKILALSIVGAILGGCGSDNDNSVSATYEIMAFDPAVMGMKGTYNCDNGVTGQLPATSFEGISKVSEPTVVNSPETCAFAYNATAGAVDVSNGKDMSKVSYTFPKGLATLGTLATASPISTLIEKELDGQPYNEATGVEVLTALGLGDLLNNGSINSAADLLLNTEEVIADLPAEEASQVSATTAVLSDVLVVSPDADVDVVSATTVAITEEVIADNPNYPESPTGETIYYDLTETPALIEDVVDAVEKGEEPVVGIPGPKPAKPTDPTDPTGGTGGTGGGGNGG